MRASLPQVRGWPCASRRAGLPADVSAGVLLPLAMDVSRTVLTGALAALLLAACNGQFEFDKGPIVTPPMTMLPDAAPPSPDAVPPPPPDAQPLPPPPDAPPPDAAPDAALDQG